MFVRNDVLPFKTATGNSKLWSGNGVDSIHIFSTSQEMDFLLKQPQGQSVPHCPIQIKIFFSKKTFFLYFTKVEKHLKENSGNDQWQAFFAISRGAGILLNLRWKWAAEITPLLQCLSMLVLLFHLQTDTPREHICYLLFIFLYIITLGIKSRVCDVLCKGSTTELHTHPPLLIQV